MKTIYLSALLIVTSFALNCDLMNQSSIAAESKTNKNETAVKTEASATPHLSTTSAPATAAAVADQTANKTSSQVKKAQTIEPLPHKIDDRTAESPVYNLNSKYCKNNDKDASEGEDFVRECKGYGGYVLGIRGMDYRKSYSISAIDPKLAFTVMLFPLEQGDAEKYIYANKYDQKLADKIDWILDDKGKPYAIFVHAFFYKNIGSAKTFNNPKNKVAEFVLLRGLAGYKEIDADIAIADTAYNPDEWARKAAYEVWEKRQGK